MKLRLPMAVFTAVLFFAGSLIASQPEEGQWLNVVGVNFATQRYADGGELEKGAGFGEVKFGVKIANSAKSEMSNIRYTVKFYDALRKMSKSIEDRPIGSLAAGAGTTFDASVKGIRGFRYYLFGFQYRIDGKDYCETWMGMGEMQPAFLVKTPLDKPETFILIDDMESIMRIGRQRANRNVQRKGDFEFIGVIKNISKYPLRKVRLTMTFSPDEAKPVAGRKTSKPAAKSAKTFEKSVTLFSGAALGPGEIREFDFKLNQLPPFKSYTVDVAFDCPEYEEALKNEPRGEAKADREIKLPDDKSNPVVHLRDIVVKIEGAHASIEFMAANASTDKNLRVLEVIFTLIRQDGREREPVVLKVADLGPGEEKPAFVRVMGGADTAKFTYKMRYGIATPPADAPDTAANVKADGQ